MEFNNYYKGSIFTDDFNKPKERKAFKSASEEKTFKVKELGNKHFWEKNYQKAVEIYLLACDHAKEASLNW